LGIRDGAIRFRVPVDGHMSHCSNAHVAVQMMLFLLIGRNPIHDVSTFKTFKSQKDHWQEPLECDKRPYADEDIYRQVM
jgi:hypothetical protein